MSTSLEQTEASVNIVDHISHTSNRGLVSDNDFAIFQWVVGTFVCQGINIFGICTNAINIACFTRQGFKDPVNVSLTGLAISDMCSLITLIWLNICLNPSFSYADLPFIPIETQYLIGGIPHSTFARITGWITALITLERCLCITVPLKVKDIVTSRRVSIIILIVCILHLISVTPLYVASRLEMKWSQEKNKTVFGLIFSENRQIVENVSFVINNVLISFSAFLIIIICTGTLVFKLHRNQKWRKKATVAGKADILLKRNQGVAKMVVIISLLFIICFSPVCISFLAMVLVPGLAIDGKHKHVLFMSGWIGLMLESINSSVNIFIYYHMSSKFRETFNKIFLLSKVSISSKYKNKA